MPGSKLRRAATAALVICWGIAAAASPASAHNVLEASTPADGAVLDRAPATILLDFNDEVLPRAAIVQVRGPGGDRADSGDPTVTADKVRQRVDPPQRPGRYTIAYRVVSADGHPITGELAFTLTESAADPADAADAAEKAKEDQAQSAPADTGDHEDPATAPDTSTSAQRDASADSGTSREAGRTAAPQPPPGPAGTAAAPSADDGPGMIPLALLVVAPVLLAAAVVLTLRARRGAADAQDT